MTTFLCSVDPGLEGRGLSKGGVSGTSRDCVSGETSRSEGREGGGISHGESGHSAGIGQSVSGKSSAGEGSGGGRESSLQGGVESVSVSGVGRGVSDGSLNTRQTGSGGDSLDEGDRGAGRGESGQGRLSTEKSSGEASRGRLDEVDGSSGRGDDARWAGDQVRQTGWGSSSEGGGSVDGVNSWSRSEGGSRGESGLSAQKGGSSLHERDGGGSGRDGRSGGSEAGDQSPGGTGSGRLEQGSSSGSSRSGEVVSSGGSSVDKAGRSVSPQSGISSGERSGSGGESTGESRRDESTSGDLLSRDDGGSGLNVAAGGGSGEVRVVSLDQVVGGALDGRDSVSETALQSWGVGSIKRDGRGDHWGSSGDDGCPGGSSPGVGDGSAGGRERSDDSVGYGSRDGGITQVLLGVLASVTVVIFNSVSFIRVIDLGLGLVVVGV